MSLLRFHGVRRSAWVALWMSAGAVAIVGCGGEATTDAESTTATASALTDEKEQAICNQLLVPENAMLHAPCGSYKETCTNGTAWGIYGDQFCADCRDTDGNAKHSCVTKAGCPEWSLWNDTGALRCGTKPEVTPQPVSTVQGLVDALESADDAQFLTAVRHFQREPVWGGLADTAGGLRARGALGLARQGHEQFMLLMADLLVDPELHILNIATAVEERRRGVARALMQETAARGRKAGAVLATLEVRRSNAGAIALYRSLGYRQVGIRPNYYADEGEDAIVMIADL